MGGEAGLIDAQDVTEIPGGLGETVLIVEDEESILKMTQMMLERMGYKVLVAGTPGEAIALAREHAGEIRLLITDVVMPEMNGRDLAGNLLSLYPNLKRLFMSGYTPTSSPTMGYWMKACSLFRNRSQSRIWQSRCGRYWMRTIYRVALYYPMLTLLMVP